MIAIRLHAVVGDDRKLTIQLPEDIPPGQLELTVRSIDESDSSVVMNSAREAAKAKLLAAGALVTQFEVPADAVRLSIEERIRLGTMPADARPSIDLINQDRGDW
jgi:hypothetical protein